MQGARTIFLQDGFEGASVDDIAQAAGVSKATLYSYFTDKRLLFAEVAQSECRRQAEFTIGTIDLATRPAVALRQIGEKIISFITSEFGQTLLVLCASESRRFPELGQAFYQSGPQLLNTHLAAYLRAATAAGHFDIDDFELAAHQFDDLCKTGLIARLLCGVSPTPTPAETDRILNGAIDMFLARYGPAATAPGP